MLNTDTNRLRVVFDLVSNPEHWKLPIDAVVLPTQATREEIREAVSFYTGSVASISETTALVAHAEGLVTFEVPAYRVTAIGYYAAVGA